MGARCEKPPLFQSGEMVDQYDMGSRWPDLCTVEALVSLAMARLELYFLMIDVPNF
jgi:predicted RNA-binding protein with PIN domain